MATSSTSSLPEPLDTNDAGIVPTTEGELDDQPGRDRLAWAADVLAAIAAHDGRPLADRDVVIALADLAVIAGAIGALTGQTRGQLAAWATVDAHLRQAHLYAQDLQRCLHHACATFAYAMRPPRAA
jgi:hypothetical protein